MQKLGNLEKWRGLGTKEAINLPRNRRRKIRLDVYAEVPTRLSLINADGEDLGYLATVDGLDGIEFIYDSPAAIIADAPIRYYHNDDESTVVPVVGEALTKIIERQPRNLEFEAMQAKVMANMERRFAKQAEEYRAAMDAQSRMIRDLTPIVNKKAEENEEPGDESGKSTADKAGGKKAAKPAKTGGNDSGGKNAATAAEAPSGDAD